MRDGLNRRASGTDDRHTLVAQVRQLGVIRRAAGVIIVPTRVEEYFPFEVRKTLDRRQLRLRQAADAQGDKARPEDIAFFRRHDPALDFLIPAMALRFRVEQRRSEEHTSELQSLLRISSAV